MKTRYLLALVLTTSALLLSSCTDKDSAPLSLPATYESPNFTTNAAAQIAVGNRLEAITAEVKKGRTIGKLVSVDSLTYWFTKGTPSLKTLNTSYYGAQFEGTNGYFARAAKASGNTYVPSATIMGNGGNFGSYLFDENGLEFEQMIEKGMFGAVLYNHAATLFAGKITTETVDQAIAIFGANPSFPNTPTATKTTFPDRLMANYSARRDKNDGKGFYTTIKNAFITLNAAVKAGEDYNKERNEAVATIKLTWEKVNAATVINYCHAVTSTLSATTVTSSQKASALHAYGECVGFIHGYKGISQKDKIITDAQIDEILVLLNAPSNSTPTSYKFITEPITQLPRLALVISKLKAIYGFTDSEIEDFKSNSISVQGR